jgi:phage shock protein C
MQQPRLTRSTTDKMLFGVCGGLGEYFHIDPGIVRLIFVLVTLTSFMGPPVYVILVVVTPRQPKPKLPGQQASSAALHEGQRQAIVSQQVPQAQQRVAQAPSLEPVGSSNQPQPPQAQAPAVGETVKLSPEEAQRLAAPRRGRNWRTLGYILLGIGGLVLLEELSILSGAFAFPVLLIIAGIILLRRSGWKGPF